MFITIGVEEKTIILDVRGKMSGKNIYICSGNLLNDNIGESVPP